MIGPLEIAANAAATLAIYLAGRNSIHTWWTGILGCGLFALLFFEAHLYADVLLQGFFIASSAFGWWHWQRGDHGQAVGVAAADYLSLAWTVPAAVVATAGYGALLYFFTNAYAPFVDSAVLVLSVIAQLLLMQRRIENWACWLLVNSIAVPLYAGRGLYLTAFLYGCYWVHAIVAWSRWRRLARQPSPALAPA
jgi:nicotinamide mononucleotide transporter